MNAIKIIKKNGETVDFNRDKLLASLAKSRASDVVIQKIVSEIENSLYNGISTSKIYKNVFEKLHEYSRPTASRYNLKKAIMELGPTGYPFENFVGELLKYQGYKVKVGVNIQGQCVQHEVDVVAEKGNQHFMIECKYHSSFKTKCSVKIPLYIQSRFLDIEKQWVKKPGHQHKFHQGWIVNNTRFSKDALQYGSCMGLKLIGWDYPKKGSLKELISKSGLYPITCLNTLNTSEKLALLKKNIVLCKQLCENTSILKQIGIKPHKIKEIVEDANALCRSFL
jgi:Holliday junction resolvase-like predicted endonuclease